VKALLPAVSASIDASLKGQARTDAIAEALIVAIKRPKGQLNLFGDPSEGA